MDNRRKQVIALRTTNKWSDDYYSQQLANVARDAAKVENDGEALYTNMVARNNQKKASLRKLYRVSCEMGGEGWNLECDNLNSFYRNQDAEIRDINLNYEAMFEDYRWATKSDAYIASIKKQTDSRVAASESYSKQRQESIRTYYSGTQLTWALQREKQRTRRQALRYRQRYYNVISRQRYLKKQ